MNEANYLELCKQQVEERFNWGSSEDWKEGEYIKLAKDIVDKTEISLSADTLKRLYGKVNYNKNHRPQPATKNALAKYLDYKDWDEFINAHREKNTSNASSPKVGFLVKFKTVFFLTIVFIFVGIGCYFIFSKKGENYFSKSDEIIGDFNFKLSVKNTIGEVPFTTVINYDITKIPYDSVYMNFDSDTAFLKKDKSIVTRYYMTPYCYKVYLGVQGRNLDSAMIVAISKNWFYGISYYEPNKKEKKNGFWVKREKELIENGYFDVSYDFLKNKKGILIDTTRKSWVEYRKVDTLNVKLDDFFLHAKVRNEKGSEKCKEFILKLSGENMIKIRFVSEGCYGKALVIIGDKKLEGQYNDLSALGKDLSKWATIDVRVSGNKLEVMFNELVILQETYEGVLGNLWMMSFSFMNSGMIDDVRLENGDGVVKYATNFED